MEKLDATGHRWLNIIYISLWFWDQLSPRNQKRRCKRPSRHWCKRNHLDRICESNMWISSESTICWIIIKQHWHSTCYTKQPIGWRSWTVYDKRRLEKNSRWKQDIEILDQQHQRRNMPCYKSCPWTRSTWASQHQIGFPQVKGQVS